jgi:amidohydrolase
MSASVVQASSLASRIDAAAASIGPRFVAWRRDIHERLTTLAEAIARSSRASCTVCIRKNYPVTVNDPKLTGLMVPTLRRSAGEGHLMLVPKVMGPEDLSFFQQLTPGLFIFTGVVPPGTDPMTAAPNHSPRFFADERCLVNGVRALAQLACDHLESHTK